MKPKIAGLGKVNASKRQKKNEKQKANLIESKWAHINAFVNSTSERFAQPLDWFTVLCAAFVI